MIRTTEENIGDVSVEVMGFCEAFEASMKQQYFISMTVEELAMAILNKGLKGIDDGYIQISVLALEDNKFEIHLRDNAVTFNPFELEHSGAVEGNTDFNAVGVSVIKSKAEKFFYRRYQGFNYLVLRI
jgi:anti-sigma regulatory factor (Ser/Thr protein kinase)